MNDREEYLKETIDTLMQEEMETWDDFDDHIYMLGWLSDSQIMLETEVMWNNHPKMPFEEIAKKIVSNYKEFGNLLEKERMVIEYYLAHSFTIKNLMNQKK